MAVRQRRALDRWYIVVQRCMRIRRGTMVPSEWKWEALSAAACEAYETVRWREACHLWDLARALAADLPAGDPRRAASASNFGITLFTAGQMPDARAAFEDAVALWASGLAWIDTMEMSVAARSSVFHLRMEQRHMASYQAFRRSRNKDLLRGSIALTKFNLALVKYHLNLDREADELIEESIRLRRTSCGATDPQFATMLQVFSARLESLGRRGDADAHDAEAPRCLCETAKTRLAVWTSERPSELCDQRRLLAAAYLTALVHERDFM